MDALKRLVSLLGDLCDAARSVLACFASLYLLWVMAVPAWNAGCALVKAGHDAFAGNLIGVGIAAVVLAMGCLKAKAD